MEKTDFDHRRELSQALRFGLVGALNTLVDYLLFLFLVNVLHLNLYLAQCFSYSGGILNSYVLNRRWTFGSDSGFFSLALLKFLCVNALTLLLSLGGLSFCTEILTLSPTLAKLATVALTLCVGFLLNRLWVFSTPCDCNAKRKRHDAARPSPQSAEPTQQEASDGQK